MRTLVLLCVVAALGCGKKQEPTDQNAKNADNAKPKPVEPAMSCPPGSAVKDGACVAVITPDKVAAIGQQQSRLDELAKLLDAADNVAAPVELLDGFRQLDGWKTVLKANPKLQIVDDTVAMLKDGVAQLHALRGSLGEASQRLGNLKGELDHVMQQSGTAQSLADLQGKVKADLQGMIAPLETQVTATIQKVIVPVTQQLNDTADLVVGACAMAKMSGGGDKLKALCGQAKDVFGKATAFLNDFKDRPATLFDQFTTTLEQQLGLLVDSESKQLLDGAQARVNAVLKLPPAAAGSGSASASGSAH
jgi:hypothetical protein